MARRSEWTILINGGGVGGLTLAALLGSGATGKRLSIQVVEAQTAQPWNPDDMDLRVYALSRASENTFDRLGIWHSLAGARASAYERMHVWEGDDPKGTASICFDAAEIGEPNLGHIVEDRLLKDRLRQFVETLPNVVIATGSALESMEHGNAGIVLRLSQGERLRGDLLVGADGANSTVRRLAALSVIGQGYGQRAIVAHLETSGSHERTARQRFMPGGPLAFLPLADGRSSIVWSLPDERATQLLNAADDVFLEALQAASGGILGQLGPVTRRVGFPLQVLHAPQYVCERIVLMGDAAHTVHPLAGQGMNLGVADAAVLAVEIEEGLAAGRSPADAVVLRRYERRRKAENLAMLASLDALNRMFRSSAWAAPIRAAGLGTVDRLPAVKRFFMHKALGVQAAGAPRDRVEAFPGQNPNR